jgi:predicted small lipoprotein YifL
MNRSRFLALALMMLALAGCGHNGTSLAPAAGTASAGGDAQSGAATAAADPAAGNQACSGGLTANEPGVVRVTCGGTATIHVRAGDATKDFHGGECHSAGDVWSVAAGVIIDMTGSHGKYAGPPVDSVAVNNTATAGKGTIQLSLGGKNYFDLGNASMTVAAGGKGAHLKGTSERLSDAPGTKLTIDVTC